MGDNKPQPWWWITGTHNTEQLCPWMLGIGTTGRDRPSPPLLQMQGGGPFFYLMYIVKFLVGIILLLDWMRLSTQLVSYKTDLNQLGYNSWTNLNQLYMIWSGFWKLRVQSKLVAVAVAPDQGPKTGPNWTFKHYLSAREREGTLDCSWFEPCQSWWLVRVKLVQTHLNYQGLDDALHIHAGFQ